MKSASNDSGSYVLPLYSFGQSHEECWPTIVNADITHLAGVEVIVSPPVLSTVSLMGFSALLLAQLCVYQSISIIDEQIFFISSLCVEMMTAEPCWASSHSIRITTLALS